MKNIKDMKQQLQQFKEFHLKIKYAATKAGITKEQAMEFLEAFREVSFKNDTFCVSNNKCDTYNYG